MVTLAVIYICIFVEGVDGERIDPLDGAHTHSVEYARIRVFVVLSLFKNQVFFF